MSDRRTQAKVYHADAWGLREHKYAWLEEHDWGTTEWQETKPESEFYLFAPRDAALQKRYRQFVKVTDIFPVHSVGIVTSRDKFVIDFDKESLKRRIRTFLDPSLPDEVVRETFGLRDSSDWKLSAARRAVRDDPDWERRSVPCLYRPFDVRWLFYHPAMVERGREEVMQHMLDGENMALHTGRAGQVVGGSTWNLLHCSQHLVDFNAFYRGGILMFPLYLYSDTGSHDLLTASRHAERQANLHPEVVNALGEVYGREGEPVGMFHYVYAILHALIYREEYADFLRNDFPRIPFTSDPKLFQELAELGERLVDLHLLRSPELGPPVARFQGAGEGKVVTSGKKGLRYDADSQRVYINQSQYFEGLPPEVWEYQIGGYQVCHKWLKDRKDRILTLDEIRTYCRITTSLAKTMQIQAEIDELYPLVEEKLLLATLVN